MNVIPLPSWPATRYKYFRSSIKFEELYDLERNKTNVVLIMMSDAWSKNRALKEREKEGESTRNLEPPMKYQRVKLATRITPF